MYSNHKKKKIFNSKFDNVLQKLELRLSILLVRINFVPSLALAKESIKESNIVVNGKKRHPNYQVKLQDFISKNISILSKKNIISPILKNDRKK